MATKLIVVIVTTLFFTTLMADPLGTAFTYQGELKHLGTNATGPYDFQFELFDVDSGGSAVAGPVSLAGVNVVNGIFTVELDFGSAPYTGDQLWLAIAVKEGGSPGAYTSLIPRQAIYPTPYAIRALSVESVSGTEVVDNSLTADDLAEDSVGASELADGSVATANIQTGAVTLQMNNKTALLVAGTATTPSCSAGYALTGGGCLCTDSSGTVVKQTLIESRPNTLIGGGAWVCTCAAPDYASAVAYCAHTFP